MRELLKISVKCREISVELEGEKGIEKCVIREMISSDSDDYMESNKEKLEFAVDDKGKLTVKNIKTFKGIYSSLLIRTLFHENGNRFTEDEIGKIPASAQRQLFDAAQELNAITEADKEKAKN